MNQSKGLRIAIKHYMPEAWEKILRKYKIYQQYVEYVYMSLPDYMKGSKIYCGKVGWYIGLNRIKFIFKNWAIDECIQGQYKQAFKKPIFWNKIKAEIMQYNQNCR